MMMWMLTPNTTPSMIPALLPPEVVLVVGVTVGVGTPIVGVGGGTIDYRIKDKT